MNNPAELPVTAHDSPRSRLRRLKGTSGLSFRALALVEPYIGIPPGTLSVFHSGGKLPAKYRAQLGYAMPPPRIAIHKTDMPSAARTLIKNLDPEKLVELMDLLMKHAVVQAERFVDEILPWWRENEDEIRELIEQEKIG